MKSRKAKIDILKKTNEVNYERFITYLIEKWSQKDYTNY